jgi:hypothetical protein
LEKTDEDQRRRCPVAGARSRLPVIPPCLTGTNWRGPPASTGQKAVYHTPTYI